MGNLTFREVGDVDFDDLVAELVAIERDGIVAGFENGGVSAVEPGFADPEDFWVRGG